MAFNIDNIDTGLIFILSIKSPFRELIFCKMNNEKHCSIRDNWSDSRQLVRSLLFDIGQFGNQHFIDLDASQIHSSCDILVGHVRHQRNSINGWESKGGDIHLFTWNERRAKKKCDESEGERSSERERERKVAREIETQRKGECSISAMKLNYSNYLTDKDGIRTGHWYGWCQCYISIMEDKATLTHIRFLSLTAKSNKNTYNRFAAFCIAIQYGFESSMFVFDAFVYGESW